MSDEDAWKSWPVWATARVAVQPADPQWQRRGRQLREDLDVALACWLAAPTEHVGSTAVPGLAAEPVLDLQAALSTSVARRRSLRPSPGTGWHLVPAELDARPWRRFLVRAAGDVRVAHLHLMTVGSEHVAEQLAFRDELRAEPVLRQRYAALKQALVADHVDDRADARRDPPVTSHNGSSGGAARCRDASTPCRPSVGSIE